MHILTDNPFFLRNAALVFIADLAALPFVGCHDAGVLNVSDDAGYTASCPLRNRFIVAVDAFLLLRCRNTTVVQGGCNVAAAFPSKHTIEYFADDLRGRRVHHHPVLVTFGAFVSVWKA